MQERHLCWPPTFFLGPAVLPQFFHSGIATGKNDLQTFLKLYEKQAA